MSEMHTLEKLNQQLSKVNQWLAGSYKNALFILNQLETGVIIIEKSGCVAFLSRAAEQMFDREHSHALGQPWQTLLPLSDESRTALENAIDLPARERTRLPVHWTSAEGKKVWMEIEVRDDLADPDNRILFLYDVSEVADLQNPPGEGTTVYGLCGRSKAMQRVYRSIRSISRVDTTVLIEGETGTGKELVARAIHFSGNRKVEPFLAINCAGLTESLLTSQLFGHRRGSFTGALSDQIGLFEAADRGTLFLDEVGDIPLSIQSSLLRVLQEKEITRIGEAQPRKIDVRIIAATNRDLGREVVAGNFRQDLYYRIRVATVSLPPLRERLEDIDALVPWLLGQTSLSMGLPEPRISSEAMEALKAYSWPGNVRQLRSALESALIQSNSAMIRACDLPDELTGSPVAPRNQIHADERARLLEALANANGNRTAAARLLQMSRATFYRSLARLNIRLGD